MLESISWQEFISTIALLVGGYYFITVLLLYSNEITNFVKDRKPWLKKNGVTENQSGQTVPMELMGAVRHVGQQSRHTPRDEKVDAESLSIAAAQEPEEPVEGIAMSREDDAVLKSVSTLREEVNVLAKFVVVQSSKHDCAELFRILLSNYANLVHTIHEPEITAFIHNSCKKHCEFQLELNEVKSWWPQQVGASVNNPVTIK